MAGQVGAWQGVAWSGEAWHGMARYGMEGNQVFGCPFFVRPLVKNSI